MRRIIAEPIATKYPATILSTYPDVTVYLDVDSSAEWMDLSGPIESNSSCSSRRVCEISTGLKQALVRDPHDSTAAVRRKRHESSCANRILCHQN
jgi:hypothetical protein